MSAAFTRRALVPVLAFAFLSSCADSGVPAKTASSNDVEGAPKLARDAGAVLLQVSAYGPIRTTNGEVCVYEPFSGEPIR